MVQVYRNSPAFSCVLLAKIQPSPPRRRERDVPPAPPGNHSQHGTPWSLFLWPVLYPAPLQNGGRFLVATCAKAQPALAEGQSCPRAGGTTRSPRCLPGLCLRHSFKSGCRLKILHFWQVNELPFSDLSPLNSRTGNMSNLQHLTEKESSCFVLLWPVTLWNNDVRMCWDKPDEVLSAY